MPDGVVTAVRLPIAVPVDHVYHRRPNEAYDQPERVGPLAKPGRGHRPSRSGPEGQVSIVDGLLRSASHARRDGRLRDAGRELAEALAVCRQTGDDDELVSVLKALGQLERDQGRPEAAQRFYEEAVDLCRKGDKPLDLAHTVRHLGDVHRDLGATSEAEVCYVEALALYEGRGDVPPLHLANVLRPLALIREAQGRSGVARGLWVQARDLYAALGLTAGVEESEQHLERLA